jgi:hypothetical protein
VGIVAGALRGASAGVVATAAMDLLWYRRYRSDDGGTKSFTSWEFSSTASDFGDDAPAPARVGKRIADTAHVGLPDSAVAATNDIVHWLTGIGWGKAAGVAVALGVPALGAGVATGVTAWGTSYAVLGRLGIYKPITEYDRRTLWKDLSAHLVYGLTLGATLTAINTLRRR